MELIPAASIILELFLLDEDPNDPPEPPCSPSEAFEASFSFCCSSRVFPVNVWIQPSALCSNPSPTALAVSPAYPLRVSA